jgi:hypothetical protein
MSHDLKISPRHVVKMTETRRPQDWSPWIVVGEGCCKRKPKKGTERDVGAQRAEQIFLYKKTC